MDEGSNPFELSCMLEVLGIDRPELGGALYDVRLCARDSVVVMRQGFFTLGGIGDLSLLGTAETVIVPNRPETHIPRHPDVLGGIRAAHARGARLIGTCSGAFTLAEAGVLGGHRVTAHWQWASEFRHRFPDVELDESVLFVDDGQVLTSAGSAAALDLALHVVGKDHGAAVAASVARRLVFTTHRDGGQRQFIERPQVQPGDAGLAPLLDWAQDRLDTALSTTVLARQAGMSVATLHRRFVSDLGTTPLVWVTARRVDLAAQLLEETDLPVDSVADRCGAGSATNLRRIFKTATGLSPADYRRARRPASEPVK